MSIGAPDGVDEEAGPPAEGLACGEPGIKGRSRGTSYLVAASKDADLLILGSRGRHGFSALGSVSERVAHKASCPVLVVR